MENGDKGRDVEGERSDVEGERSDVEGEHGDAEARRSSAVEAARSASPMPFENLDAPEPIDSSPPEPARWLAFAGVLIGGLLGGLIGFGVGDLMGGTATWSAVGAFIGGVGGAIGVGIIAQLTLRAMSEWNAVHHPEATGPVKKR